MNDTGAAIGNSTSSLAGGNASMLTTVHLAIIAVLAVLVVIGIIHGIRLKHRRTVAERTMVDNAREAGVEARQDTAPPEPAAPPPPPPAETVAAPAPDPIVDEPIAAAAPQMEAASAPAPADADPADGPVDQLKGLGPKVATRLGELGITTVGQIAALSDDAAATLDAQLGAFQGRMARDRWIEQARFLAAGDRAGFEAVFGKL